MVKDKEEDKMLTVKRRINGTFRIEDGVIILRDNIPAEHVFDAIEKEIRERTGAAGDFDILTTTGEKIRFTTEGVKTR